MSGERMPKIVTKEVTKDKQHLGWKVYIEGEKYPKKPIDYYNGSVGQAVKQALLDFINTHEDKYKCKESVVNFKILPTDRIFTDSPDAGEPECLCSRCGLVIPESTGVIRAWIDINTKSIQNSAGVECISCGCTNDHACPGGCYWVAPNVCSRCTDKVEYRFHPECLGV